MTANVTVRYYAAARAAAGIDEEGLPLPADLPLQSLLAGLASRHGADLARVLDISSFLINGLNGPRDRVVPADATVDVLPPFAGG